MRPFKIHTNASVSPEIGEKFNRKINTIGFVPNIFALLAESEVSVKAFEAMNGFFSDSSLSATEQEVVGLVTSVENRSGYCTAGHSAFSSMIEVPENIVNSIRDGSNVCDERLQALASFTKKIIRKKGRVSNADLVRFFDAGFTQAQVMEVILGISIKMISNFASSATLLPLDDAFAPFVWSQPEIKNQKASQGGNNVN